MSEEKKATYRQLERRIEELENAFRYLGLGGGLGPVDLAAEFAKSTGSEFAFKALVEQASDGIAISSLEGSYLYVNPAFCKMSGFSREELLKMTVFDVKAKTQPHSSFFESKSAMAGLPIQVNLVRKDGTEYMTEIIGTVIRIGGGEFVLGTVRKISDRELTDFIIREKNAELNVLNATKDKLFAVLAHDLKNPMGALLGLSKLIDVNAREKNWEKIESLTASLGRTIRDTYGLLENLLEWSMLQQGGIKSQMQTIELTGVVAEIVAQLAESATAKSIEISYRIPAGLKVICDDWMLKTVLRNLLFNAIKFTGKNGQVTVFASAEGDLVELRVTDTGVGISGDRIPNLFGVGGGDSTLGTEKERGTGFGLSLCKELLALQGGTIRVESQISRGTTFFVNLQASGD